MTTKKTGDPLIDDHFELFWAKYPKKVGKQKAIDRWLIVFNKTHEVKRDDWPIFTKRLCDAIDNQNRYRKRINEIYPSYKERNAKGIFMPPPPNPATWLNEGRWEDEIPRLPDERTESSGLMERCEDCIEKATVIVDGHHLCAWHWTKRFNKPALKQLAEANKRIGLDKRVDESREQWMDRCRVYALEKGWEKRVGQ